MQGFARAVSRSLRLGRAVSGSLAIGVLTIGCGGGGGGDVTAPPRPVVSVVEVTPAMVSVVQGQQLTISERARDASGATVSGQTVRWTAQDTTIASVDASGTITARSVGRTAVTASVGAATGTAAVVVTAIPVAAVVVSVPSPTLVVGQSEQSGVVLRDASGAPLNGRTVTYSSSDTTVATINAAGSVSALAPGSVTLSATSESIVGTVTLTVTPVPVATVALVLNSPTIGVGQTTRATATARDAAGNALAGRVASYTSSDPGVATVGATGVVTAVAVGTATLTATIEGHSGTASVTVTVLPVATVKVNLNSSFLAVGQATPAGVVLLDANGNSLTGRAVTYATSNAAVATVNSAGTVQAIAEGAATITATSEGRSGTATITVDADAPKVASVTITPSTIDVTSGAASTTMSLRVTDAGSGVQLVNVNVLSPPTNAQQVIVKGCFLARTDGTANDGTWSCTITFPQGSPAGTWTLAVGAIDAVSNRRDYRASDLDAMGQPSTIVVRSN